LLTYHTCRTVSHAQVRQAVKMQIDGPLLVIGDASSSMNVAVRTATIIAGFVASLVPPVRPVWVMLC
jgi:hypothetical protein